LKILSTGLQEPRTGTVSILKNVIAKPAFAWTLSPVVGSQYGATTGFDRLRQILDTAICIFLRYRTGLWRYRILHWISAINSFVSRSPLEFSNVELSSNTVEESIIRCKLVTPSPLAYKTQFSYKKRLDDVYIFWYKGAYSQGLDVNKAFSCLCEHLVHEKNWAFRGDGVRNPSCNSVILRLTISFNQYSITMLGC
jgi:hypothetical protein